MQVSSLVAEKAILEHEIKNGQGSEEKEERIKKIEESTELNDPIGQQAYMRAMFERLENREVFQNRAKIRL